MSLEFVEFLEFVVRISELDFYHDEGLLLDDKVQQTLNKVFFIF